MRPWLWRSSRSPTDRCDWDEFARFMLENTFPFHVNPSPTREEIESRKADGVRPSRARASRSAGRGRSRRGRGARGSQRRCAIVRRLSRRRDARNGLGEENGPRTRSPSVRHLSTDHAIRGADTRRQHHDEPVLLHNGFVKEAHYRRTWPVTGGSLALQSCACAVAQAFVHKTSAPVGKASRRWEDWRATARPADL